MMTEYEEEQNNIIKYDVAFSFAGEQRDYVEQVYNILHNEYNLNVFYDADEEIEVDIWGTNLVEKFDEIYGNISKFCIMFISKEYEQKIWTTVERRSALSKAIREKSEYILPARFDDTEITGFLSTTSYIDLSKKSPRDFSKIILKKLGIQPNKNINKNHSDILLNVNHTQIIQIDPIDKAPHKWAYITIKVENHGNRPVYLKYPLIKVKNSTDSFHIYSDDLSNKPVNIGKLEAGDSYEIYVNPIKYNDFLNLCDFVEITDKIGRTFRTTSNELHDALISWDTDR